MSSYQRNVEKHFAWLDAMFPPQAEGQPHEPNRPLPFNQSLIAQYRAANRDDRHVVENVHTLTDVANDKDIINSETWKALSEDDTTKQ